MTQHLFYPWQILAPFLLIAIPFLLSLTVFVFAQIKWPYDEPNRPKGKDHEDQHQAGMHIPEDERSLTEEKVESTNPLSSAENGAEEDCVEMGPMVDDTIPSAREQSPLPRKPKVKESDLDDDAITPA